VLILTTAPAVPVPENLAREALVQKEKKQRGVVSEQEAPETAQQVVTKALEGVKAAASETTVTSPEGWTEELAGRWAGTDRDRLCFLLEVQARSGTYLFFLPAVGGADREEDWTGINGDTGQYVRGSGVCASGSV
jgi:hypothetical protein